MGETKIIRTGQPDFCRQVVLAKRPQGLPSETDFQIERVPRPIPGPGEILVRAHYLSADPFQRMRLDASSRYGKVINLGDVIKGRMVGDVVESNNSEFVVGDFVEGMLGWREYATSDGSTRRAEYAPGITKVDPEIAPISTSLGVLGFPGITAYFALLHTAEVRPGETVVITAAAGAVGSLAGQIAKLNGCKVIGVAGSDEKTKYLENQLGFDATINYRKSKDFPVDLKALVPEGTDVFFDNTGGLLADGVLTTLNQHARVVLVGNMSQNSQAQETKRVDFQNTIMVRRAIVRGFIVYDFEDRAQEARTAIANWMHEGHIQFPETTEVGIESAPKALISVLTGGNLGKQLIRLPISIQKSS